MKRLHPKTAASEFRSRVLLRWPALSYGALPVVIFALIFAGSLLGYGLTTENVEGARDHSIQHRLSEDKLRIATVFSTYAHLLWGSTGEMQTGPVDNAAWQRFMSVYHLSDSFAGTEAVGVAYGTDAQTAAIAYVSPETDLTQKTIGTNLALEPSITAGLAEARSSGDTTLSATLPNIFSTKSGNTTTARGFLMIAPFYDTSLSLQTTSDREAALRGYTVALFRGDTFFDTVFRDTDLRHMSIKVYLGSQAATNLQYQINKTTDADQRQATQTVTEYGKTFTITYGFDTASIVPFSINYLPQFLLIGGVATALLVAGISSMMFRSRYRRLIFQKEQDVNFAKDELLSLASHQLRTPATGVKQYLGMVLQGFAGDLTAQQRTYLERAYSSNNRQLHVINDILHLAKLEAGRIVLAERKFDIADMVREVVDEQKDEAKKGEVTLQLVAPPRGMIMGDSHMLRMVVENLVSNAIKYTPSKGKVTVRLVQRGKSWVFTVKDTGVGIADKDLGKLFKQFSRIANARSDFVTGTGIGLYLAHHLVVLHGGSIGVSSTEGKGSTFTVRLPRKV